MRGAELDHSKPLSARSAIASEIGDGSGFQRLPHSDNLIVTCGAPCYDFARLIDNARSPELPLNRASVFTQSTNQRRNAMMSFGFRVRIFAASSLLAIMLAISTAWAQSVT